MLRLHRRLPPLHQRHKRLLEDILRLVVAQTQRPAVENQLRGLRFIEALAPAEFSFSAHISSWNRHLHRPICINKVQNLTETQQFPASISDESQQIGRASCRERV